MVGGSNPPGGSRRIKGIPTVAFGKPFFVTSSKCVKSDGESQEFRIRMHEGREALDWVIEQLD